MNRRTKIVATIGPASWDEEVLRQLITEGVDVVRLNFSHADLDQTAQTIELVRRLADETGRNVAILQDLQGPRIRVGALAAPVELEPGHSFTLTTRATPGSSDEAAVDYAGLPHDVAVGDLILLDDGLLQLRVEETTSTDVRCRVMIGGALGSHKGINVPGVTLNVPTITDKDIADLRWGVAHGVDMVALSFVRRAQDIHDLRALLRSAMREADPAFATLGDDAQARRVPPIIAKIEKHEAITNFDEILAATDGVMVARGDLGVEMLTEQLPLLQKMIIQKCNVAGKPVITATQMLDSMIRNPRPTRAEASDVANAILDGTDATMLSGESAAGHYPVLAVQTMRRIAETTETSFGYDAWLNRVTSPQADTITDAISQSATHLAHDLNAAAIIALTTSGFTARMIARVRPRTPLYAFTAEPQTFRNLAIVWGVQAVMTGEYNTIDEAIRTAHQTICQMETVKEGDRLIVSAGVPIGQSGHTNMLRVLVVGQD